MSWGGWAIEKECYDYIRSILPEGSTVLELGSGYATQELSKHYNLISIEQDRKWLFKYDSTYIYAPLRKYDGLQHPWFDVDVLKNELPIYNYDLILVDAPVAGAGKETSRWGFTHFIDLFKTDVPIIFDDVNRPEDYMNMINASIKLNREYKVFTYNKSFGVI